MYYLIIYGLNMINSCHTDAYTLSGVGKYLRKEPPKLFSKQLKKKNA
jgi:hypothetical protein